ncbi:hypothetical protein GY45DRAFT_564557 [Cubamyces sp. BRFM 1775]|nr:hypothetical protein GY45DRAFT_564557 [Cubamyces sp. BRFM 1775]
MGWVSDSRCLQVFILMSVVTISGPHTRLVARTSNRRRRPRRPAQVGRATAASNSVNRPRVLSFTVVDGRAAASGVLWNAQLQPGAQQSWR